MAERFAASAAVTVSMLVLTRRSWTLTAAVSEEAPVDCCERSTVAVEPSEASTALIRVSMVPVMRVTVAASVVDCTAAVEAAAASIAVIEAVSVAVAQVAEETSITGADGSLRVERRQSMEFFEVANTVSNLVATVSRLEASNQALNSQMAAGGTAAAGCA